MDFIIVSLSSWCINKEKIFQKSLNLCFLSFCFKGEYIHEKIMQYLGSSFLKKFQIPSYIYKIRAYSSYIVNITNDLDSSDS